MDVVPLANLRQTTSSTPQRKGGGGEGSQTKPSTRDNSRPLSILMFNWDNRDNVAVVLSGENINETLPKALTALTSNFGLEGLVQYAW